SGAEEDWSTNKGTGGGYTVVDAPLIGVPLLNGGPAGCATAGALCADGTRYAGVTPDGKLHMFTTPADAPGTYTWNDGSTNYFDTAIEPDCFNDNLPGPDITCATGQNNTALLAGAPAGADAPYAAAEYCDGLSAHGYTDWYLPSQIETNVLYTNRTAIGGFAAVDYWTSSEAHIDTDAAMVSFGASGTNYREPKDQLNNVRCVRKSSCADPYGMAGDIVYNADSRVLQWCDGYKWLAAGPVAPGGPTGGCDYPDGTAGIINFNSTTRIMQYCDGGAWQRVVTASDACVQAPGGMCQNGMIYAGRSPDGNQRMYITDDTFETNLAWGPDSTTGVPLCVGQPTGTPSCSTGYANSQMIAALGPTQTAVTYCTDLVAHGYDDWYLPARNELVLLVPLYDAGIGNLSSNWYASSSESSTNHSWLVNLSMGGAFHEPGFKPNVDPIRCARLDRGATNELDVGLVHHWKLDEANVGGGDTIFDAVGGVNGTVSGTLDSVAAQDGNGVLFNANNEYITFPTIDALRGKTQFTLSAWMKRTASNSLLLVGELNTSTGHGGAYLDFWNDSNVYWAVPNSAVGGYDEASAASNDTNWHLITLVYDGTQTGNSNRLRVYRNGVLVGGAFYTGTVPAVSYSGAAVPFIIGRWTGGTTYHSRGTVDDVRIYNRPLSAEEVMALYLATGG
ncbi:MAG: hypothetical protein KJ667_05585, partial [Alphaproteobacteria bacterium]|nr:hypothetical protein [Alphaproteobacteria bacterium]